MSSIADSINSVLTGERAAVLCGFGSEGQKFAVELIRENARVDSIYDDNNKILDVARQRFPEATIGSIEDAAHKDIICEQSTVVFVCSHSPLALINRICPGHHDSIVPLYAAQCLFPDIFKPFLFYEGLIETDSSFDYLLDVVADCLEDRLSRQVFSAVRRYRRDFAMSDLKGFVQTYSQVLGSSLFRGTDIHSYVDGGVYDGDTIDNVAAIASDDLHVHAYEPSKEMASFLRNKYSSSFVTVHEMAISSRKGTIAFADDSSRTSMIADQSSNLVTCTDLDSSLYERKKPVDLVKLNIEGAELDALRGAKSLILTDKPVLAIHAYHRPSHLWEIPLMIKSINPDYKVYFRQQDCSLMESVFYAFP